jgi:hypothetical protein
MDRAARESCNRSLHRAAYRGEPWLGRGRVVSRSGRAGSSAGPPLLQRAKCEGEDRYQMSFNAN